ncbi:tlde1 domain-containing protein [Paraburkholderia sediminicola]|uniref:tlde1 domain-containing protein n=1 Tax=Paraburkholderia sediminicola TaxID=458836 RepID=UPI0038BD49C8
MPWSYQQSTGNLSFNGEFVERGYSGAATGKNNPAMQAVPNIGPIPRGSYQVGEPHTSPHTGTYTLNLTATAGTNTFGRSAFRIHGDSLHHPGTASEGCIIMGVQTRHRIWVSGDRRLEVIQ